MLICLFMWYSYHINSSLKESLLSNKENQRESTLIDVNLKLHRRIDRSQHPLWALTIIRQVTGTKFGFKGGTAIVHWWLGVLQIHSVWLSENESNTKRRRQSKADKLISKISLQKY